MAFAQCCVCALHLRRNDGHVNFPRQIPVVAVKIGLYIYAPVVGFHSGELNPSHLALDGASPVVSQELGSDQVTHASASKVWPSRSGPPVDGPVLVACDGLSLELAFAGRNLPVVAITEGSVVKPLQSISDALESYRLIANRFVHYIWWPTVNRGPSAWVVSLSIARTCWTTAPSWGSGELSGSCFGAAK